MKNIFSCIKDYKKDTLLTPIFVVAEVLMEVLIPYFMASLFVMFGLPLLIYAYMFIYRIVKDKDEK